MLCCYVGTNVCSLVEQNSKALCTHRTGEHPNQKTSTLQKYCTIGCIICSTSSCFLKALPHASLRAAKHDNGQNEIASDARGKRSCAAPQTSAGRFPTDCMLGNFRHGPQEYTTDEDMQEYHYAEMGKCYLSLASVRCDLSIFKPSKCLTH